MSKRCRRFRCSPLRRSLPRNRAPRNRGNCRCSSCWPLRRNRCALANQLQNDCGGGYCFPRYWEMPQCNRPPPRSANSTEERRKEGEGEIFGSWETTVSGTFEKHPRYGKEKSTRGAHVWWAYARNFDHRDSFRWIGLVTVLGTAIASEK